MGYLANTVILVRCVAQREKKIFFLAKRFCIKSMKPVCKKKKKNIFKGQYYAQNFIYTVFNNNKKETY